MVIACIIISFDLLTDRDDFAAEERAADAARQVSVQLRQMVDDSVLHLGVASDLNAGREPGDIDIAALTEHSNFSGAAILDENQAVVVRSGIVPADFVPSWRCGYTVDGVEARLHVGNDGQIRMHVSTVDGYELAGWIDGKKLDSILNSAFDEEYGYLIYNTKTGACLLNASHFTEKSYYDSILQRNENGEAEHLLTESGSAEAHIEHDADFGEGGYYIAQTPIGIDSLNISLIVPEQLVDFEVNDAGHAKLIELLTLVVLLLSVIASAVYCRWVIDKRRNQVEKFADQQAELLNTAAAYGNMIVFVYNRKDDVIERCYGKKDSAFVVREKQEPDSIHALSEYCGFIEQDIDKLRARINKLKAGEEAETCLQYLEDGEEQSVNVSLNCSLDNPDRITAVVYRSEKVSAADDRALEEQAYYRTMLPKSVSIWTVNAGKNTWNNAYSLKPELLKQRGIRSHSWRSYDEDLNGFVRQYIHPDDYQAYYANVSEKGINALVRSGKDEFVHEYRVLADTPGTYEWHRQIVRVYKNPDSGDILANLYVQNIDAEKKAELERKEHGRILNKALTALGGVYYGLFYAELESGMCYTAKAPGGEMLTGMQMPYRETIEKYILETAQPDDRDELLNALDAYSLRKNLSETNHCLRFRYRKLVGEEYRPVTITIQAARLENGTVRDVVIALQNIHN